MSDRPEGRIADAGDAVQRTVNKTSDAQEQLTQIIRERPISSALVALGIGYLLGKIF